MTAFQASGNRGVGAEQDLILARRPGWDALHSFIKSQHSKAAKKAAPASLFKEPEQTVTIQQSKSGPDSLLHLVEAKQK